jgi:hypothetical protein
MLRPTSSASAAASSASPHIARIGGGIVRTARIGDSMAGEAFAPIPDAPHGVPQMLHPYAHGIPRWHRTHRRFHGGRCICTHR